MSVPYTGDVILISQKCCPSASSLEPRIAAVPQLYSEWKLTLRLSQLSNVAVDLLLVSQTQSKSVKSQVTELSIHLCPMKLPFTSYVAVQEKTFLYDLNVDKSQSSTEENMMTVLLKLWPLINI